MGGSRDLESLTDQLDGCGQCVCAEAEGARDQARLTKDVAREVEGRRPSKPLIVTVFIDLKPRTGRISCLSLPWSASMMLS